VRPALEVADIFRRHGAAYRAEQAGCLSNSRRRVMAAIEACRTAALGGHVEQCEDWGDPSRLQFLPQHQAILAPPGTDRITPR
jgi:hypothetical protein